MVLVKKLFTAKRVDILSQLLVNLSAGWFGVVLIIPGITKLQTFNDWLWLTKNLLFGIVALWFAIILSEQRRRRT